MSDTDSDMMRHQQDLDTPQHIDEHDETAATDKADSDPASAAARASALANKTPHQGGGQDDVLGQNKRSSYTQENEVFEDGRTDAKPSSEKTPPLASKGRSLLGN
ncbi:hypothetical protein Sa4125_02330 [Aureimonas sp. SA4125]|uniref:hypothetical protein n=1 Tax=Aureimonas sp. SA4125 TaxID=2826993 RepID=UPI001CC47CC7|nr:hypothetical protein [Aureimonas sp. SA4125]BDA82691.1 hypothetical protein Sa4125_02330 [Aureimonas sp. SA4125]